ncbi:MAG: NAD-binding protein [Candidatus Zixiibacteriota bacterium]|nr:MAG: NAD-binding protein [candidate division Zixibacteria bacterium]
MSSFELAPAVSPIRKLSNHCLIAGYSRVGRQVAEEFAQRKTPFIVMESAPDRSKQLVDDGYLFARGDATSDEVLKEAGIDRAQTLVSQEAMNSMLQ